MNYELTMSTTQEHIPISDIQGDIIILKTGGGALILSVSAVNFGLLSEREQFAIISAFAQMLNSLNFSIQIVIHSERLNISSYLNLLDIAQQAQGNSLLSKMIVQYRQFIQTTIKDNDVLDKKFYVVIPLYKLELGLLSSKQILQEKIKTVLMPRRDQVIRQLQRVGLKATQLSGQKLLELFYDIYNGQFIENLTTQPLKPQELVVSLKNPQATLPVQANNTPMPYPPNPKPLPIPPQTSRSHPFVTEELEDV